MNKENNLGDVSKLKILKVKEETAALLYDYIGKRMQETRSRVTVDDAIRELLEAAR